MAETHEAFRMLGDPDIARCHACTWSQVVDEDLHEDAVDRLLQWHIADPAHQVDHLAGPRPGQRLAVPPYVEWFDNQGHLAVKDTRTGGYYLAYNQQCLAIFRSVTEDGTLEGAVADQARHHDVHRALVRSEIEHIAGSQYRKGLLQPAAATS
ncbi:hypothetical protein PV367_07265 [Streptomyces europaeiscabiei]|uniref:Uncharacterized protein n=1 Tax=Streptomyces europaeiscabiei TaxID=146819 RepID=A0AAJ2UK66_9ACTN|nr:hypothetical protein [Streptomyces europaeiscabiei]MDX3129599.1 hypothetical protein [Streptomyces europaeiscabiei]